MSNILYGDLGSEHTIFNESIVQENSVSVLYGSTKDYIAGFKSVGRGTLWYYVCKYNARNAGYLSGTYEDGQTDNAAAEMFGKTFHSIEDFESQAKNGSVTFAPDGSLFIDKNNIIRILHYLLSSFNDGEVVFVKIDNHGDKFAYIANVTEIFSKIYNAVPQTIRKYLSLAVNMDNGRNKIAKIVAAPIDFRNDKACKYFVDCSYDCELEFEPEPIVKYWADIIADEKEPDSKAEEIFAKTVIPRKLIGTDEYHIKCPYDYLYRVYLDPKNRLFYSRLKNYYTQCINWSVLAKYIPAPEAMPKPAAAVPPIVPNVKISAAVSASEKTTAENSPTAAEVNPIVSVPNKVSEIQSPAAFKSAENTAAAAESEESSTSGNAGTSTSETAIKKIAEKFESSSEPENIPDKTSEYLKEPDTFKVKVGNKIYTEPTKANVVSDVPTSGKKIEPNNSKDLFDNINEKVSKKIKTQNYENICRYAHYFSEICDYVNVINREKISINNLHWDIPDPEKSKTKRIFLSDFYNTADRTFDFHKLENESYSEYLGLEQYLKAVNSVNYKDRDEVICINQVTGFYIQKDLKSDDLTLETFYKLCAMTIVLFFGSTMDKKNKPFSFEDAKNMIGEFDGELYNRKYNIILFHFLYITFNTLGIYHQAFGEKENKFDDSLQDSIIKKYNIAEKIKWLKNNCEGTDKNQVYEDTFNALKHCNKAIQNNNYKKSFAKLSKRLKIK